MSQLEEQDCCSCKMWPPGWCSGKEPGCQCRTSRAMGSIPGSGRSPGVGKDNPLQYSCLENPMDRWAWWGTVHGITRVGHGWVCTHTHNVASSIYRERRLGVSTAGCWYLLDTSMDVSPLEMSTVGLSSSFLVLELRWQLELGWEKPGGVILISVISWDLHLQINYVFGNNPLFHMFR